MKTWYDWQIIRRQVAIGGRVVDGNNNPLAGVEITITSMPEGFKRRLAAAANGLRDRWVDLAERQGRARSRLDGIYFFLDLPEGSYTLSATDPKTGKQVEKSTSVSWDEKLNIKMKRADFKLSA